MPTPKEDSRGSTRKTSVGQVLEAIGVLRARSSDEPSASQRGPLISTSTQDKAKNAFNDRIGALLPMIREFERIGGEAAIQAKGIALQAGVLATQKDWQPADALLDQARALLDQAPVHDASKVQADFEGAGTGRPVPRVASMMAVWVKARRRAMEQVEALQVACAEFDDEELQAVAHAELLSGIGDAEEDLEEALLSGEGIKQALSDMRSVIETDLEIKALDDNPMGVTVSVAKTLLGALGQMASIHARA